MTATPLPHRPDSVAAMDDRLQSATGCVDAVTADAIFGWAWCPSDPDYRVDLEILAGETVVATLCADELRDDLVANGVGDGRHAFSHAYGDGMAGAAELRVRVKGTSIMLPVVAQAAAASRAVAADLRLSSQQQDLARIRQRLARQHEAVSLLAGRMATLEANAAAAEGFLLRFDEALKALPSAAALAAAGRQPPLWLIVALSVVAGFAGGLAAAFLLPLL